MTNTSILRTQQLRFAYRPDAPVLCGIDLAVCPGRFTCILGPNGSGKTTLLRCLLGVLAPSDGRILLNDKPLRRHGAKGLARLLAYVPQFPTSAFAFTVQELVLMGRYAHAGSMGLAGPGDLNVARHVMQLTGTLPFAGRTLNELSGGEAQCVMIARALAQEPAVLLLDEPTSHLDVRNQLQIYRLMSQLARQQQMAVVCVSHDINLAARFADELLLMRDGNVLAHGPSNNVIKKDTLEQLYGVNIDLITTPDTPTPFVWAH